MDSGFGPAIVTWEGMAAWSALTGTELQPWEAQTIIRLGVLRANVLSEEKAKDKA